MSNRKAHIVEAALVVAQTQGLAAMSMRAVAAQAGSSVMALYRHLPTKEALLDELVGRLLAEIDLLGPSEPWRTRLRHLAGQFYDLATRYPSVIPLLMTRAYVATDAVRVVDATRSLLRDAAIPEDQLARVERMVSTFLLGYTTSAANSAFWSDPAATTPPTARGPKPGVAAAETSAYWRSELDRDITDLAALVEHLSRTVP